MKKLWNRLSRPVRVGIHLALIAALVLLTVSLTNDSPPNVEEYFRKAETSILAGPAKILAIVDTPNYDASQMVIAEEGDNVIFFLQHENYDFIHTLAYRKKQGDVTVYPAPNLGNPWHGTESMRLPVVLFDSHPTAVRAELDFTLLIGHDSRPKDYHLATTVRTAPGLFVFSIPFVSDFNNNSESYTLYRFSSLTGGEDNLLYPDALPVTVRLYDANDNLVHRETVTVQSLSQEALLEYGPQS